MNNWKNTQTDFKSKIICHPCSFIQLIMELNVTWKLRTIKLTMFIVPFIDLALHLHYPPLRLFSPPLFLLSFIIDLLFLFYQSFLSSLSCLSLICSLLQIIFHSQPGWEGCVSPDNKFKGKTSSLHLPYQFDNNKNKSQIHLHTTSLDETKKRTHGLFCLLFLFSVHRGVNEGLLTVQTYCVQIFMYLCILPCLHTETKTNILALMEHSVNKEHVQFIKVCTNNQNLRCTAYSLAVLHLHLIYVFAFLFQMNNSLWSAKSWAYNFHAKSESHCKLLTV